MALHGTPPTRSPSSFQQHQHPEGAHNGGFPRADRTLKSTPATRPAEGERGQLSGEDVARA